MGCNPTASKWIIKFKKLQRFLQFLKSDLASIDDKWMVRDGSRFLIQPSIGCRFVASCGHGNQIQKESGGGGAGAAGRDEGRAGADGQHDAGATQGRGAQSGSGSLVKKV